ncbi:uncharacterized protein LOC121672624 isoform X1 [Corvus kubaryi]|uniref:uncharacterized protein LOC121672623 n=1 Tax=Corvus kubaryi TaxID=68294 RepID=UPI001C04C6C6|nr:uncharacterized protein LOC121672623 [Corvus kubaryi]XP_041901284.1 uncharacterized protein LOC121672623 [Corvus kubaryi]XP_041901286.1 uncharacterized protein LOC121672623 [Corvus kubaryi]XP_041901287.1 uncharacterized protein LOC121672624 isoform X1 [Corvus kubaryi]XP_041901288.1 uncharacterized protein LOC121672624 isoform X1 [Corvus kubaryi]XP_041901289.1 uncharacterized protein LOC121672624 isoform X1 [Corvus kubaryi]
MLFGPAIGLQKNIPAAKKMAYLATGCTPVGEGKGRGIHLWGFLMVLSLTICLTHSTPLEGLSPREGQKADSLCELCQQVLLEEQETHQSPENCKGNGKHCDLNGTQFQICELEGKIKCLSQNARFKKRKSEAPPFKTRNQYYKRHKRNLDQMPVSICDHCNHTVWVGGKKKSISVAYSQINKLCYDNSKLSMCLMDGKTYWVGKNLRYEDRSPLGNEPVILDLLEENDDRACLQYDNTFCFSKNKDGMDPENTMKQVTLDLKRQESEIRKKRIEQERLLALSKQYDLLEKQYNDWEWPAPNTNLFIELMQEIATELGLCNCWICGGLKSAEKWPWKGEGLAPEQLLKRDKNQSSMTTQRPEGWILDPRVIGIICISREGSEYTEVVGYTPCISTLAIYSNNKSKIWQPEPPAGYWSQERKANCDWNSRVNLCWYKQSGANPYQSLEDLKE